MPIERLIYEGGFSMKNTMKFLMVIAFAAVIVFVMTVCDDGEDNAKKPTAQNPVITLQPQSKVYFPGVAAEPLTVTASVSDGGSLSYQWYSGGTAIEGANAASYTPSTTTAGTVKYYVKITNTNQGVTGSANSDLAEIVTGFKEAKHESSINSVAFGGGRFVIGFGTAKTAWSSDGINWTEVDVSSVFGNISIVTKVAYFKDRFIALAGAKMGWSTNGESWTAITTPFGTSLINDIAYDGTKRFFIVGNESKTAYSDDNFQTWNSIDTTSTATTFGISIPASGSIESIVYGNNRFIAIGSSSKIAYFDNTSGTNWTGLTISLDGNVISPSRMIYANDNFIVVGGISGGVYNKLVKASNGTSWTDIRPSSIIGESGIIGIGYGSGKLFIFAGSEAACWSEDNGANWTELPIGKYITSIVYGNGVFVAIQSAYVYYAAYP